MNWRRAPTNIWNANPRASTSYWAGSVPTIWNGSETQAFTVLNGNRSRTHDLAGNLRVLHGDHERQERRRARNADWARKRCWTPTTCLRLNDNRRAWRAMASAALAPSAVRDGNSSWNGARATTTNFGTGATSAICNKRIATLAPDLAVVHGSACTGFVSITATGAAMNPYWTRQLGRARVSGSAAASPAVPNLEDGDFPAHGATSIANCWGRGG